jgi:hypothetical protein
VARAAIAANAATTTADACVSAVPTGRACAANAAHGLVLAER